MRPALFFPVRQRAARRAALAAAALLSLTAARSARADGAFPDSLGIVTPAQLPDEILLATNFGVVASIDAGQTWTWSCEQMGNAFGSLYQMGPPPLDRLFAVSQGRLVFSDDTTCTWAAAAGAPAGAMIVDAFADPSDPNHVLAVAQIAGDDGGARYAVLESRDAGATLGTTLYQAAPGDTVTGVEIARTRPATIYVTIVSAGGVPELGRSDDSGATWHLYDLGAELAQAVTSVRLISVAPDDPARVLLRVRGAAGELVAMTTDSGATASAPLAIPGGVVTAFARTASGIIVVGGTSGATPLAFRSTDRGQTFASLPAPPNLRALSARGETVYGVADNFADGYAIGVSEDAGMTWQALVRYDQIQAITACVKAACQDDCHARAAMDQWPDAICDATPMPLPVIADAGAPDASGDAAAPPPDAGRDASPSDATPPTPARAGCACALATSGAEPRSALLVLGATLVWASTSARRPGRRQRRSRTRRACP